MSKPCGLEGEHTGTPGTAGVEEIEMRVRLRVAIIGPERKGFTVRECQSFWRGKSHPRRLEGTAPAFIQSCW